MKIGFNKSCLAGNELIYISNAVKRGKTAGNGYYTKLCHRFFERQYGYKKVLLTSSCTDALEMAAILLNIKKGDEVIVPSYTFVSTANAFILRGAKVVFADSQDNHPNMGADALRPLITSKTKAIVVVHYAGIACDMDKIMSLANEFNLFVVEDAAQAIDTFYKGKPVGSFGHLACFSFHESKNIVCGEGGLLVINDERFMERAEIIWEKGTNRASFCRGEINQYEWVDVGSSFLLSDINAAFLFAQLEKMEVIQRKRLDIWNRYHYNLTHVNLTLPHIPGNTAHNAHSFYLVCEHASQRAELMAFLLAKGIETRTHYLPLHLSPFFVHQHDGRLLPNAQRFADCLVRLPFYYELSPMQQLYIAENIEEFFIQQNAIVPSKAGIE